MSCWVCDHQGCAVLWQQSLYGVEVNQCAGCDLRLELHLGGFAPALLSLLMLPLDSGTCLCTREQGQHLPGAADPVELVQGAVTSTVPTNPKGHWGSSQPCCSSTSPERDPPAAASRGNPGALCRPAPGLVEQHGAAALLRGGFSGCAR